MVCQSHDLLITRSELLLDLLHVTQPYKNVNKVNELNAYLA